MSKAMQEYKRMKKLIMMLFVAVAAFCMTMAANGAGLDGFCGFKAGELRKSGKNGDQKRIEIRPKAQFRRFNKVWLSYSDSGKLAEVRAVANVRSMKAAAAKKEFEECIKWFRQAGMSKEPGDPGEEWSDDKARDDLGCIWRGRGEVKTKEAHLDARVEVCARYYDPAMYKGDKSGQATGWILSMCVKWSNVDDRDLVPGAALKRTPPNSSEKTLDRPLVSGTTPKRANQKMPVKTFVEQTFRTSFQSACPVEAYDMIMAYKPQWRKCDEAEVELLRNRPTRLLGRVGDEDADFARFLGITLNQTPSGVPRHPYIDVISPRGRTTLPGVRFAYGRYLARAVCGCESVMFAYSNPKDKPGAKESVGGAEDLCLCALVLWGYDEDVKDGDKAAAAFGRRVESWLGINFAETNVTEKAKVTTTVSTFREGDLTVTATACAETIDTRYFVDKRGREIKGAKLQEFYLEFQHKVTAKMMGAPRTLSNEEREAMQKDLEKKLFDSHGVKERFRKTVPMKYHVVISSGMPPPLSEHRNAK